MNICIFGFKYMEFVVSLVLLIVMCIGFKYLDVREMNKVF